MTTHAKDTVLRSFDWAITPIHNDLSVINRLKRVHLTLFDHLFGAFPQIITIGIPLPRHTLIGSIWILGFKHERCHEFETKSLTFTEP